MTNVNDENENRETLWRDGQAALVELLATMKEARARTRGSPRLTTVLKTAQFALLFNYDLRALQYDIDTARDEWARGLYGRLLALTLYECSRDLSELLGRDLRKVVTELAGGESLQKLGELHSELTAFQRVHGAYLRGIRNQVVGHRDHDPDIQLDQIENLDITAVVSAADILLDWLTEFWRYVDLVLSIADRSRR